ncbi:MAG: leucine-rich repeat domain-containing protein [Bacteroidales bacterium]|nr:leucine-rich repeat domain-containing protein [Bacteroidales bacterium]
MTNKIKFSVLLTLFTFVSFITTSAVASVLVDGIYYEMNKSDKTAAVANSNETYTGVIDIPASFVYEGTTYTVTTIDILAFIDCVNVETVKIPSTVTSIKPSSFERCGLTSIEIGNGVVYIDFEAFRDCNKLTKLTLPSSLEIIENEAFAGCTSLAEIYVNRNDPPKLVTKAFDGVDKTNCKVYVPTGRKSTYARATGWKDFSNISEYSFNADVTVTMGAADNEGNRWASFCCNNAVLLPAGLTAYYASEYKDNGDGTFSLMLTAITSGNTLPAKKGLLLCGSDETYTLSKSTKTAAKTTGNLFAGTVDKMLIEAESCYLLGADASNAAVMALFNGTTLAPNTAYLPVAKVGDNAGGTISFSFAPEQGIEQIFTDEVSNKEIYNLQGQRLNDTHAPGMYIVGGRKVWVK